MNDATPMDCADASSSQSDPSSPIKAQAHPGRKRGADPNPIHPPGPAPDALLSLVDTWPTRFTSKFEITPECWVWTACRDSYGYGRYGRPGGRGTGLAHRYVYELAYGEPPTPGLVMDHLCRNPSCVRPDHLDLVPQGTNVERGAVGNSSGLCRSGRHPWVAENIVVDGAARRCRPCRNEWYRDRERRRRAAATEGRAA